MLPDYLTPGLLVVFVGTSVGTTSAEAGHYYSARTNEFWKLLWETGLTGDRQLTPEEDASVLEYGIGLTDIVKKKAASSDALLLTSDYDIEGFLAKIKTNQPLAVAFNGVVGAKRLLRAMKVKERVKLGALETTIGSTRLYVLPSSSSANADRENLAPKISKADWWRDLGTWLKTSADQSCRI